MPGLSTIRSLARRWSAGIALAMVWGSPACAQIHIANEDSVKAAFILNFAKYTEWPAADLADGLPLRICSPSRNPLEGQLARLQGKPYQGRTVEVRARVLRGDWSGCHILFLAADDSELIDAATRVLAGTPVLLVSDSADFVQRGGIIELKTVGARMRFDINLAAAQRSSLKLSSHMLRLAGRVVQ